MSWSFDVNKITPNQDHTILRLKSLLKAVGWVVPRSSDGIALNLGGDQISHHGTGGGGLGNNRAWFVLRTPDAQARELCFQRVAALQWRVKYSGGPAIGFVTSPGVTTTPSATDQQFVMGGGTDASPTGEALNNSNDGRFRAHMLAGGADEGYSFLLWTQDWAAVPGGVSSAFCLDVCHGADPADVDPAVLFFSRNNEALSNELHVNSSTGLPNAKAWFRKGETGGTFMPVQTLYQANNLNRNALMLTGRQPFDIQGPDRLRPVAWGRPSNHAPPMGSFGGGLKGLSRVFLENDFMRSYGAIISLTDPRDRVVLGGARTWYNVPWDGSVAMLTR